MSMLHTTEVPRCLERKLNFFGFEVMDLIAIFSLLSVLNFTLGPFVSRLFFVWLPTATLAGVLYFGKRGKPENYLTHFLRYHVREKYFSAFKSTPYLSVQKTIRGEK